MSDLIRRHLYESAEVKLKAVHSCMPHITALAKAIVRTLQGGNKLLIFGNGGSAADAQHFAAELVVKYKEKRRALPAIALTTDTSVLTAIGNDFEFNHIFSRQVEALGKPTDMAIGISTSGHSPNVLFALLGAHNAGLTTVLLTGALGKDTTYDFTVAVPSKVTAHIQEAHIAVIHAICGYVDANLLK